MQVDYLKLKQHSTQGRIVYAPSHVQLILSVLESFVLFGTEKENLLHIHFEIGRAES